jgi:hypothetical protein
MRSSAELAAAIALRHPAPPPAGARPAAPGAGPAPYTHSRSLDARGSPAAVTPVQRALTDAYIAPQPGSPREQTARQRAAGAAAAGAEFLAALRDPRQTQAMREQAAREEADAELRAQRARHRNPLLHWNESDSSEGE